jgi:hypothetical protein
MTVTSADTMARESVLRSDAGAVTGAPLAWLRLEGLAVLILAALLYYRGGHSWLVFAVAFLAPDLSLVAYLGGARAGAIGYDIAHSYVAPALMAGLALVTGRPPVAALIWIAHIGLDRAFGYGLKYPTAFEATHLGRLRRGRPRIVSHAD